MPKEPCVRCGMLTGLRAKLWPSPGRGFSRWLTLTKVTFARHPVCAVCLLDIWEKAKN